MDYAIDTAINYWQYVAVYGIVAAVVTFAVLYRMGPISNPRTFDLIQWTIQFLGLCLIYFSTQMQELSLAVCGVTLLFYLIPIRWVTYIMCTSMANQNLITSHWTCSSKCSDRTMETGLKVVFVLSTPSD